MPTISEENVAEVIAGGNGASSVIPASGGGHVKLTYLWGKLRVDRCDAGGKILPPERRVGGGDIPPPEVP